MTQSEDALARLAELSDLIKERNLARLATTAAACQSTKAALEKLNQDLSARAKQVEQQERPDPAQLFGADERWRRLVQQRQATLSEQLAREMRAHTIALEAARKAVGRADILAKLAKK